jgi:hypothetical protein
MVLCFVFGVLAERRLDDANVRFSDAPLRHGRPKKNPEKSFFFMKG